VTRIGHVYTVHHQGKLCTATPPCFSHCCISQDTVAVRPSNFGIPPEQAIIAELNKKFANRVLHDVGLCICVFDLSQAGEGRVRYGDGCLWYKGASFWGLSLFFQ
jgi:hypothetical protein